MVAFFWSDRIQGFSFWFAMEHTRSIKEQCTILEKAKIAVPDGHCTLTCWNCLKDDNFFEVKKIFKVKKNYNVEIECANFHEATINSIT